MAQRQPTGAAPATVRRPPNNTTCDIYHVAGAPPATPDVENQACGLVPDFRAGSEASAGSQDFRWTHVLYVDAGVDVRDTYPSTPAHAVYVPDQNGTEFEVVFVELVNRGTPAAFKRVYLERQEPNWPTEDL